MTDTITRIRRVNILDCEGFRYMSNTRYIYYMDFIRFEIMFRSKLYEATVKKGMLPTLASQKLIYKKPLRLWNKFSVTLKLMGWDDKWVYHCQTFKRNNQIYAIGYTKVGFLKKGKVQNTREILTNCGVTTISHPLPKEIEQLFNKDSILLKTTTAKIPITQ